MIIKFKEEQLVRIIYLVKIDTNEILSKNMKYNYIPEYKHNLNIRMFKTWIRVKFIDNDDTFIGEAERIETNKWSASTINVLNKGEHYRFNIDRVHGTENIEKQFCYSDNVIQCDCPGTCRNK